MLRATGIALSIWVAVLAPARLSAQAEPELSLQKEVLADGIYLFRAPGALDLWTATNSVVIVNDQDVTVFDSNTRPVTARMVIAEIRKITDKPVRTLINSHWHMDHWSGNDEYVKAFPGVQIIATIETRDYMKRMGPGFFTDLVDKGLKRAQADLDTAIQTGKLSDGTVLTDEERRRQEKDIADTAAFAREVGAVPRVLPSLAFSEKLVIWSGRREFRLFSAWGDATGSAVLYLPAEKILVMGDVLVSPESGDGPPPWTTNSYAITPWLASLRTFEALDAAVVVPGQGPAFRDKTYLRLTADLFAAVLDQVHAALERGLFKLDDVQAAVDVDAIGRQYTPGAAAPADGFHDLVASLVKKAYQEAYDGVIR